MSPSERLKELQERLQARGVLDVKLTFAPGFELRPLTELYADVADFLDAWLQGHGKPIMVGDAPADHKDCWACNGTGVVTTSSNGSGPIEATCENCLGDPPHLESYAADDVGYSALADGCYRCQSWVEGKVHRPKILATDGWWKCERCGGSYGAVE